MASVSERDIMREFASAAAAEAIGGGDKLGTDNAQDGGQARTGLEEDSGSKEGNGGGSTVRAVTGGSSEVIDDARPTGYR